MASLVATFLTAVVSTALLQFNVGVLSAELHTPDSMSSIEWAVTALLTVINLGTFVVFVGLWLRRLAALRGLRSNTAAPPTLLTTLPPPPAGAPASTLNPLLWTRLGIGRSAADAGSKAVMVSLPVATRVDAPSTGSGIGGGAAATPAAAKSRGTAFAATPVGRSRRQ